ncbi:MAG: hypothetical protein JXL85_09150 [Bacilli bacterium]|nr:hypothetical protein [Bacilli bacterium]
MKKLLLIVSSMFIVLMMNACFVEYMDATYYGVATLMSVTDGEDDTLEQLVVFIPGLGEMFIPQSDNITGYVDDALVPDYEIMAGDLLVIWFSKANDLSIMESYPGQFNLDADSITIHEHQVELANTGADSYLFTVPLDKVIADAYLDINTLEQGNVISLWTTTIVEKVPDDEIICDATIYGRTDDSLSFIIPKAYIDSVLDSYHNQALTFGVATTTTSSN